MRTWLRTSDGALGVGATAVVAVAAATLDVAEPKVFLAFAAFVLISELFEVSLPKGPAAPLGHAPALGFALLGHPVSETIVVFAAGAAAGTLARLVLHREVRTGHVASRALAVAGAAATYRAVAGADLIPAFTRTSISPLGVVAMLAALLAIQTFALAAATLERDPGPLRPMVAGILRSRAALHLSILSVAALLALSWPTLSYWSFPLFLAPLAATQYAFRQLAEIRRTYLQTIRALSKVPEMAGYTHPGHSTRVAEISVAIARELAASEDEQQQIEYAALLHDIGRVSIPDPSDSVETAKMELALVGAQIVRETGHFPRVAEMIERQHEPYRRRGEDTNRDLVAGARIIKVASSYDDFTRPGGLGLSPWDALERLHLGMAYDYDPQVIGALTRVLEKRAAI